MKLLRRVRWELGLPVIVWTGFEWDELQRMPEAGRLPVCIDAIVAGRFVQTRRIAQGMRGSDNKTVHFLTHVYTAADFERVPVAEVIISPDGQITASGVDPLQLEV
jgi:anaerobic ribonucleoside-triphosphate reductase activating protein